MKIIIEIPDAEFQDMVAKQVAAAIGDVMLRHQTQNLAAIKQAVVEIIKPTTTCFNLIEGQHGDRGEPSLAMGAVNTATGDGSEFGIVTTLLAQQEKHVKAIVAAIKENRRTPSPRAWWFQKP